MTLISKIKKWIRKYPLLTYYTRNWMFGIYKLLTYFINDQTFIQLQYWIKLGKKLSLENPTLYNEKLQWLKLNYRDPILHKCVDKWEVRELVASKGLSEILIPVIGFYNSINEVNFDDLPNEFILKLTNGSSFNEICFDKSRINVSRIKKKFRAWSKINIYVAGREWAYKDVPNRVICEKLLRSKDGKLPSDYRFYCFHGEVKVIAVDIDSVTDGYKNTNYYRHLYTPEWMLIPATICYSNKKDYHVPVPKNLNKMINIAQTLAIDFPAVRVDLYNIDGNIYFGELTFYHASGYQKILPESFELEMGSWLDLSKVVALEKGDNASV